MKIVGTNQQRFEDWRSRQGVSANNGSYWYARELEEIILPGINVNAYVITAGAKLYRKYEVPSGAVIVCHDNRTTFESYGKHFGNDILWICSKYSTVATLQGYGENAVYVPLSIDTRYVEQFKRKKTKDIAYVGNSWAFKKDYLESLPKSIQQLSGMERDTLLKEMAKYKRVIAEGRCLMEAQVLDAKCEVPLYGDGIESVYVEALDSREVIPEWREVLEQHYANRGDVCILRAVKIFNDLLDKKSRRIGEVFSVASDRAKELLGNEHNIVELV